MQKIIKPVEICANIDRDGYGNKCLSTEQFVKLMSNKKYAVLLGGSKEPVLCCVLRLWGKKHYEIKRLSVSAQARKQGECRRFLNQFANVKLTVVLKETNAVGIEVAKRLGFRAFELKRNYWDECDGIEFGR